MPVNWNQIDRAEEANEREYAEGLITYEQYRAEHRAIQEDVRGAAEEDAENAYRDAMGWY